MGSISELAYSFVSLVIHIDQTSANAYVSLLLYLWMYPIFINSLLWATPPNICFNGGGGGGEKKQQ